MRKISTATRSPSRAAPSSPGPTLNSPRLTFFLSIGTIRPPPPSARREKSRAAGFSRAAKASRRARYRRARPAPRRAPVPPAARRGRQEPGRAPGVWLALCHEQDFRRWPLRVVPFGGRGEEIAVAVARGHIGENDGRQKTRFMQALAPALDGALGLELFQAGV